MNTDTSERSELDIPNIDEGEQQINKLLQTVRNAGALDDSHGAEDWSHSDEMIDEALKSIVDWRDRNATQTRLETLDGVLTRFAFEGIELTTKQIKNLHQWGCQLRAQIEPRETEGETMYKVYLISKDGDGMVTELQDWDGNDSLQLHLAAFASDAVIEIVPVVNTDKEAE